ncbi:hypothetical protein BN8_01588 [Fibrisoma limi BUZ 3]|uniref:DUF4926 domain-containing protein n=1 Tax=Fibrisoma limi BUZ 3 TaxID=1185876 RepID=I2GFA2_9BACT|nr:DUF4926 domain-containing protein [Fibrisoma limi]CCH52577.1 hypothetical protein BN8_01588 [Fibrisoma limi BUZ 3]
MNEFNLLDVVVLLIDIPEAKLRKGNLGTIVDVFENNEYLVEFADLNGIMYALPVISADRLLKVYQEPVTI